MGSNYDWDVPFNVPGIIKKEFIELDQLCSVIRVDGVIYQLVVADGHRTIDVWCNRLNRNIKCHQFMTTTRQYFSVLDRNLAYFKLL